MSCCGESSNKYRVFLNRLVIDIVFRKSLNKSHALRILICLLNCYLIASFFFFFCMCVSICASFCHLRSLFIGALGKMMQQVFTNDRWTCFPSLLPLPFSVPVTNKSRQESFPIEHNHGSCVSPCPPTFVSNHLRPSRHAICNKCVREYEKLYTTSYERKRLQKQPRQNSFLLMRCSDEKKGNYTSFSLMCTAHTFNIFLAGKLQYYQGENGYSFI